MPLTFLVELMLPRETHEQEGSVSCPPLKGGPNNYWLFLNGCLIKTQPRLHQSAARASGLSSIWTKPSITVTSRNINNQNEMGRRAFQGLCPLTQHIPPMLRLRCSAFHQVRHITGHGKIQILKKGFREPCSENSELF